MATAFAALALTATVVPAKAASILWVSDTTPLGFSGAGGNNLTDAGFVRLLEGAGHTVARWNSPDSQNTRLSAAELATVNGYDLVIMGRAGASGQHQFPQSQDWNVSITKPLICMSPYFLRPDGGRLGWFTGGTLPDTTPTLLIAGDANDPAVDFLFAGVTMNGINTAGNYDELIDRNTSLIQNTPVAGGIAYSTATFAAEANAAATTAYTIVGFPAGTLVRTNADVLGGYRMFFGGGSREGATFPNAIPLFTGRENLSPIGDDVFLRAVQLAINNGTPPATDPSAPIAFAIQPANVTVGLGRSAAFSVVATGAGARTLQWQRDIGDGVTFTNIPDASTPFLRTRLVLPAVGTEDNGAKFRVEGINPNGTVTSDVVSLTVTPDATAPVPLAVTTLDGTSLVVYFDELLDNKPPELGNTATEAFNYIMTDPNDPANGVLTAILLPDGRSVLLTIANPVGNSYSLNISAVEDRSGNAIPIEGIDLAGVNYGFAAASVGALNPGGGEAALDSSRFQVSGGGLDFQPATEQMRFVYKSVDGDFDARVRVHSIIGTNRLESVAKAILNARSTVDGGSASISAFVTPAYPGDSTFGSTARAAAAGPTISNHVAVAYGLNSTPATFPNAWLRILRVGDAFTTFSSSNGTDWNQLGNTTITMGSPVLVGAGANSHRNGQYVTATFSNFQILSAVNSPTLINSGYAGGTFTASFLSQSGVAYRVQFKDDLNAAMWSDLTTVTGDGTVKSFNDTAGANRFYRVITP